MVQVLTYTEISDLWRHVARLRKAAGDKEGAKRAYCNARAYQGRTLVSTLKENKYLVPWGLDPRREK